MKILLSLKYFSFALVAVALFTTISFAAPDVKAQKPNLNQAIFLIFQKGKEQNPEKGFEMLKEIRRDGAQIFIAYCYHIGAGTEKSEDMCVKNLDEIKNSYYFNDYIGYFLYPPINDFEFAKTLAERALKGIRDPSIVYRNFFTAYEFLTDEQRKFVDEKAAELEKSPKENANALAVYYLCADKLDKLDTITDYLKPTPNIEALMGKYYTRAIEEKNEKKILQYEKLLSKRIFENERFEIYRAYRLYMGIACDKNVDEAKKIAEKAFKTDRDTGGYFLNKIFNYSEDEFAKLKDEKDFILMLANIAAENENVQYLGYCYANGLGIEKDFKKAVEILSKSSNIWDCLMLSNMLNTSQLKREYAPQYFNMLKKKTAIDKSEFALHDTIYLAICYKKGIGTEVDLKKAFDTINDCMNLLKDKIESPEAKSIYIRLSELLAYCYENAIGTEKNSEKAVELRQEIDKIVADELKCNPEGCRNYYQFCSSMYGTSYSHSFAEDKALEAMYEKKSKELADKIKIAAMSPQEIESLAEFKKIANLFAGRNGVKKDEATAKSMLPNFFAALENHSEHAALNFADKIMYSADSSFPLRIASMEYLAKLASAKHQNLAGFVAKCYETGKGTARNYTKAAEFKLIAAEYKARSISDEEKKRYPENYDYEFNEATRLFAKVDNFQKQKEAIEKWRAIMPDSKSAMLADAGFLALDENPFRDFKKSKSIFEDVLKNENNPQKLAKFSYEIGGRPQGNYASIYYSFKFMEKAASLDESALSAYDCIRLADGYRYAIATPRDPQKAAEWYLKSIDPKRIQDDWISDWDFRKIACYFLYDTHGRNYAALQKILDKALTAKEVNPNALAIKGLTLLNGWGIEKDKKKAQEYFEKAISKKYSEFHKSDFLIFSYIDTPSATTYALAPEITKNLLEKFVKENDITPHAYGLSKAFYKIGDFENAKKFGKLYRQKNKNWEYSVDLGVEVEQMKNGGDAKGVFERACEINKAQPKNNDIKNLLASLYYNGQGVEVNKEKATELLNSAQKEYWGDGRTNIDVMNTYVWLWKIYNESNTPEKADQMREKIIRQSHFVRGYSPAILAAFDFTGTPVFLTHNSNFPIDMQQSARWLEIAEQEEMNIARHGDSTPIDLLNLYLVHEKFKNEAAAERIVKSLKEKLDSFLKM